MIVKAAIAVIFGVPLLGLSVYFVEEASRMAREEAERERIRRKAEQAQRYDQRRRHVRYVAAKSRTGACR